MEISYDESPHKISFTNVRQLPGLQVHLLLIRMLLVLVAKILCHVSSYQAQQKLLAAES